MKIFKLIIALVFMASVSFAQEISESVKVMSQGENNAFTVEVIGSDTKAIEKAWLDYLKKYKAKTKKDKKSGEFFTDNAKMKTISSNTVDLYSKLGKDGDNSLLTVWFDLGGTYLSTTQHIEKSTDAKLVLLEFSIAYKTKVHLAQVKAEESRLKKLKNEQKGLENTYAAHGTEIEKLKQRIADLEQKKIENMKEQDAKKKVIAEQEKNIKVAKEILANQ